jgi:hypothetical protein
MIYLTQIVERMRGCCMTKEAKTKKTARNTLSVYIEEEGVLLECGDNKITMTREAALKLGRLLTNRLSALN